MIEFTSYKFYYNKSWWPPSSSPMLKLECEEGLVNKNQNVGSNIIYKKAKKSEWCGQLCLYHISIFDWLVLCGSVPSEKATYMSEDGTLRHCQLFPLNSKKPSSSWTAMIVWTPTWIRNNTTVGVEAEKHHRLARSTSMYMPLHLHV